MADTPEHEQSKTDFKAEIASALPAVESPSISPAVADPAAEPQLASEPVAALAARPAEAAAPAVPLTQRFRLNAQHKRYGLLAASLTVAAALGVVSGLLVRGGLATPKQVEVAQLDETKAMQQTVARLSKEIASLKANVEAANKAAHPQIAKINDKLGERLTRESAEVTGSISAPQTVTPVPRPAPRTAAVERPLPARPPVVADWIIRDVRDGYVYVQGHGDIYQVVTGAPLPGLGPVEQVKRQDGRWMVVTPKGLIVSMRDRRYFEPY